jgi:hypothetical protein
MTTKDSFNFTINEIEEALEHLQAAAGAIFIVQEVMSDIPDDTPNLEEQEELAEADKLERQLDRIIEAVEVILKRLKKVQQS